MNDVAVPAFENKLRQIQISDIQPLHEVDPTIRRSSKYRRIRSSIQTVGLVEPLAIFPSKVEPGQWLLLDGHVRLDVIRKLGWDKVNCLVAAEDEGFTYNKRVAKLPLVQEHFMISRALDRGVSPEKIAKALNLEVNTVKSRKSILDGICPEVIEMLKHKTVSPMVFRAIRPMKPARQVVVVDLMLSGGCLTSTYARALREGTKEVDLKDNYRTKRRQSLSAEQILRIQRETEALEQEYKLVDDSFGEEVLDLVVVCAYVARLLRNDEIARFLNGHYQEIADTLRGVVAAASPDQELAA
jgi:DNA-binding CsgD family transcriptional regulator